MKVAATSKPITFVRANVVPDSAPLCGVSLRTAGCSDVESLLPRDMEFTRVDSVMGDWPLGGLAYKTETEWNSAWDKHIVQFQHRQGVSEAPSTPSVDFSSSMLIGWSEWVQPCDWGGASITRVVEEATQVRVEYQYPQYSRLRPAEGVSCTAEYWVSPHFSFFKIAATSKPIVFVLTGVAPSLTLQK